MKRVSKFDFSCPTLPGMPATKLKAVSVYMYACMQPICNAFCNILNIIVLYTYYPPPTHTHPHTHTLSSNNIITMTTYGPASFSTSLLQMHVQTHVHTEIPVNPLGLIQSRKQPTQRLLV